MRICVLILFYFAFGRSAEAQVAEGTPCETPNNKYGTCINFKNCTDLVNLLLARKNDVQAGNFLRASVCGYIGKTPMVCCAQKIDRGLEEVTPAPGAPVSNLPRLPDCGKSNKTNPRIVNGTPAKLGEFPWIVALGYRNSKNSNQPKWLCGGALITYKHILTAGHCVHNRNDLFVARIGDLDLFATDDGANPETIPLVKAKIHEDYNPSTFTNDIAILTLKQEPSIPGVWPICLPEFEPLRSNNFVRTNPTVAGWGSLYFNGPTSSTLQLVLLPVVENDQCKRAFQNKSVIDDRVLCAGYANGGKDACQGDSGGPLMYGTTNNTEHDLRFFQIGVVSYGFRCAEAGYPGVYTRVTAFIEWIKRNLD